MSRHRDELQLLTDMDDYTLVRTLNERRQELLQLRLQRATGQLEHHRRIREVRKGVARIRTMLHGRGVADSPEIR